MAPTTKLRPKLQMAKASLDKSDDLCFHVSVSVFGIVVLYNGILCHSVKRYIYCMLPLCVLYNVRSKVVTDVNAV